MNNKYDFGRAFSDFDEDFDPFAIPYERAVNCFDVNDEFLDMNTFVLAAVASICLENSGEAGNDYCLFSQLSLLLHPDRPAAYYALHYARMFVNRLPGKDDCKLSSCTISHQPQKNAKTFKVIFLIFWVKNRFMRLRPKIHEKSIFYLKATTSFSRRRAFVQFSTQTEKSDVH